MPTESPTSEPSSPQPQNGPHAHRAFALGRRIDWPRSPVVTWTTLGALYGSLSHSLTATSSSIGEAIGAALAAGSLWAVFTMAGAARPLVKSRAAVRTLSIFLIAVGVAITVLEYRKGFGGKDWQVFSPQSMVDLYLFVFVFCTIIWGLTKGEIGPIMISLMLVALTGVTAILRVMWFGEVSLVRAQLAVGTIVGTLVASVAGGVAWAVENRFINQKSRNRKSGVDSPHGTRSRKRR